MLKNNSKFPRFITIMLFAIAMFIFVGLFFSETFVSYLYFIFLIILVVFLLLDKKYGVGFTSHKIVYSLVEVINLLAIISILVYEFNNSTKINVLLFILIFLIAFLLVIDLFIISEKYLVKKECVVINLSQILFNISLLVYFNFDFDLWCLIVCNVIELFNIIFKLSINFVSKNKNIQPELSINDTENEIEELITKDINEGDME